MTAIICAFLLCVALSLGYGLLALRWCDPPTFNPPGAS